MRVYKIFTGADGDVEYSPTGHLAIDLGFKDLGVCYLDSPYEPVYSASERLIVKTYHDDEFNVRMPIPDYIVSATKVLAKILIDFPRVDSVSMELFPVQGRFSSGLAVMSGIFFGFLSKLVPTIYFVQPNLGNFYLAKKTKTKTEVKNFVTGLFPDLKIKTPHESDSVLHNLLLFGSSFITVSDYLRDTSSVEYFKYNLSSVLSDVNVMQTILGE